MDIIGPFTLGKGQSKFLLMGIDYFTKWIEVVRIVGIKQEGVNCFYTFFTNFEGMEEANEESKPKE